MTYTEEQRERINIAFNKHFERCLSYSGKEGGFRTNCDITRIVKVLQECKEYGESIDEEDMVNILKEYRAPKSDWTIHQNKITPLTPMGGKGKWKGYYLIRQKHILDVYPLLNYKY